MPPTRKPAADVSPGYAANMEGVAAVDRALSLVDALEAAEGPLSLTALAEATGLYKSTVLRLMVSLERRALVVRRQDQHYTLGPLAFRLGRAFERTYRLEEHLAPLMRELVARGMESPSFHVRQDEDTRLCLLRFDSKHSTLDRVRAGDLLPLRKGAAGKVLRTAAAVRAEGLPPEDWVEVSFGERDPSCGAIAAPVFGPGGELLGALSLSGPLERFTDKSVQPMRRPLLEACAAATRSLGGDWPSAASRARARRS